MAFLNALGIFLDATDGVMRLVHEADLSSPAHREGMRYMQELIALSNQRCVTCPNIVLPIIRYLPITVAKLEAPCSIFSFVFY